MGRSCAASRYAFGYRPPLCIAIFDQDARGGYLRFQAQYFRRIRLPRWKDVSEVMRERLKGLSEASDRHELNEIVASLYGFRSTR
ncbi:MAG: hypothetical protein OXE85_11305 [Roseovarius sp.]|nr:hypothetical protein [Roseovarius sp.]